MCDFILQVTDLLPGPTFVDIVSQLIHNSNSTIRRKTMDLFNKRVAEDSESYSGKEVKRRFIDLGFSYIGIYPSRFAFLKSLAVQN